MASAPITATNSAAQLPGAATRAATTLGAGTGTGGTQSLGNTDKDLNRFLTLLTAQLKYQDPMSPTDPTQFVAQLAQFSQVEQQTKTNSLLQQMASSLTTNALGQTAALIGKQVNATAATVTVPPSGSSTPITVSLNQSGLSNARLVVMDKSGGELRRIPVQPGQTSVSFDGLGANQQRLPTGVYDVKLVGDDTSGQEQSAGAIGASGRVTEVRTQAGGGYTLVLSNGSQIDAANVTSMTN